MLNTLFKLLSHHSMVKPKKKWNLKDASSIKVLGNVTNHV